MKNLNPTQVKEIQATLYTLTQAFFAAHQRTPSSNELSSFLSFTDRYSKEIIPLMQKCTEEIQKQNSLVLNKFYMSIALGVLLLSTISALCGISIKWNQGKLPRFYKKRIHPSKEDFYKYTGVILAGCLGEMLLYYQLSKAHTTKNNQIALLYTFRPEGQALRELVAHMLQRASSSLKQPEDIVIFSTLETALQKLSESLSNPFESHQDFYPRLQL